MGSTPTLCKIPHSLAKSPFFVKILYLHQNPLSSSKSPLFVTSPSPRKNPHHLQVPANHVSPQFIPTFSKKRFEVVPWLWFWWGQRLLVTSQVPAPHLCTQWPSTNVLSNYKKIFMFKGKTSYFYIRSKVPAPHLCTHYTVTLKNWKMIFPIAKKFHVLWKTWTSYFFKF